MAVAPRPGLAPAEFGAGDVQDLDPGIGVAALLFEHGEDAGDGFAQVFEESGEGVGLGVATRKGGHTGSEAAVRLFVDHDGKLRHSVILAQASSAAGGRPVEPFAVYFVFWR